MVSSIWEAKIKSLQFRLFNRFLYPFLRTFLTNSNVFTYSFRSIVFIFSFLLYFIFPFQFCLLFFFGLATICTLYRDHKLHVNHAFIVYMRVGFKKRRLHSIEFANWRLHPLPEQAFTLKFKQSKSTLLKRIIYI